MPALRQSVIAAWMAWSVVPMVDRALGSSAWP
jgi:hypothetical protein